MREDSESRTAVGVAVLRAVHLLMDAGPLILEDRVILRLLEQGTEAWINNHSFRYQTPGARALRAHVLVRSRYAEDCLEEAHARGIHQYVQLGAGLDTFAYRQPEWAKDLRIVEVDHPLSQDYKRSLIAQTGIEMPANLSFVPLDLGTGTLTDALRTSSVDLSKPLFLSWLGVMTYLSPEVNARLIREMGTLPRGSEIVFTFSRKGTRGRSDMLATLAAQNGEPWLTRLGPEELEIQFREAGFSEVHFLEPAEIRRRYFRDPATTLPVPARASIVRAVV